MNAQRLAEELVSRSVALVIYHEHATRTRAARRGIDAEFRAVFAEARRGGVSPSRVAAEALEELIARYGPEKAKRLHAEYLVGSSDDIPLDPVMA